MLTAADMCKHDTRICEKFVSLSDFYLVDALLEGHPVSKNKSLQTIPNNESQYLIGVHPTHASMEKWM